MYISESAEIAKNPAIRRGLSRSRSREGFLKARRETRCAKGALRVITASPELKSIYGSTEDSPHSAMRAQRGVLRVAIFTLVAAECTLHGLSSSRSDQRKHMGTKAAEFGNTLISAWQHVSVADTDALFDCPDSGLMLGNYDHLRKLSGLTPSQARTRNLTHQTLQMAVARALLVRAICRITDSFESYANATLVDVAPDARARFVIKLREEVAGSKIEISRARSILELMGAKDSWPLIRATFALAHTAQPEFSLDDASNTFPLGFMSVGRTTRSMTAGIKAAVARAGAARQIGATGGQGSVIERQRRAALRDRTRLISSIQTPASPARQSADPPPRPRETASDLRGALKSIMLAMRAAGMELSARNVRDALAKSALPNVRVFDTVVATEIERFSQRLVNAGTNRGAKYDFSICGRSLSYTYSAFNNTIHVLRKAITKHPSQPG